MRVSVSITEIRLSNVGADYRIKFQLHVDDGRELDAELTTSNTATDASINQLILTTAKDQLELAAGVVFAVGDELVLQNSINSTIETVSVATDPAIATADSLDVQLQTLLDLQGLS